MSMESPLVLFGVESIFSVEIIETARRAKRIISHAFEAGEPEWDYAGIEVAKIPSPVPSAVLKLAVSVPWVTPGFRQKKVLLAKGMGFTDFATLLDPMAVIAETAEIYSGVFINAGAT